jgi:hypothetical protein
LIVTTAAHLQTSICVGSDCNPDALIVWSALRQVYPKANSPESAIWCLLFKIPISSFLLKVIQQTGKPGGFNIRHAVKTLPKTSERFLIYLNYTDTNTSRFENPTLDGKLGFIIIYLFIYLFTKYLTRFVASNGWWTKVYITGQDVEGDNRSLIEGTNRRDSSINEIDIPADFRKRVPQKHKFKTSTPSQHAP